MKTRTPVEVTTKFCTTADSLSDAWIFVMDKVELVGPDPTIEIKPVWSADADDPRPLSSDEPWTRHFEVMVSGMVEEKES